jgi:hypothetical protein
MIRRLSQLCMFSVVTGALLAPPLAHAFTLENDPAKTIPKFDLEEQARQFRSPGVNLSDATTPKKGIETPFGNLQFGVERNNSMFGYANPFAPSFGGSGNADRRHYERMFTPGYLQGRAD